MPPSTPKTRQGLAKVGRCALSVLLALFFAIPSTLLSAASNAKSQAFASAGTVDISNHGTVAYDGYETCYFRANGLTAWCIEPNAATPPEGTYECDYFSGSQSLEWRAAAIAMIAATYDCSFSDDDWGASADGTYRMSAFWNAIEDAAYTGGDQGCDFYTRMHVMLSFCVLSALGWDTSKAFYGAANPAVWQEKCYKLWDYAVQAANGNGWDGMFTAEEARAMAAVANNSTIGMAHGGSYQNVAWVNSVGVGEGDLDLVKVSNDPQLTNSNDCYSLAGAVYGVYSSREDAESRINPVATMTTDESGFAKSPSLAEGWYCVRETSAPAAFNLDETIYDTWCAAGETRRVNNETVGDSAKNDPTFIKIEKKDSQGADGAQGSASLAGAEYMVEYFDGLYNSADEARAAKNAARSWTFATDDNGYIDFYSASKYKVSGDDLYMSGDKAVWPLGTYVIHETKAPQGYLVSDKTYSMRVFADEKGNVTREGNEGDAYVVEGNTYIGAAEDVQRGDYSVEKTASTSPAGNQSTDGSDRVAVAGIKFEIRNQSDKAVISPETMKSVEPGEVVCTITTSADGKASTSAGKAVNGWDIPSGWHGALAVGSYSLHEVIPQDVQDAYFAKYGQNIHAVSDWKMTISKDKQSDPVIKVNNTVAQTPLKIVKVDEETGKQIPLACTFQIIDSVGKAVSYEKDGETVDSFSTDSTGSVTLPMLLAQGSYQVKEIKAADGYLLKTDTASFEVKSTTYNGWDDPIMITFSDKPAKGVIEVTKTDSETGAALAGAEFDVVAVSDVVGAEGTVHAKANEVVDHLVCDKDGKATTKELYIGAYKVIETKAPSGYVLDTTPHAASITYKDQSTPVVTVSLSVTDTPNSITLMKTASTTGKPLANAEFTIYDPTGMKASAYDVPGIKSALDGAVGAKESAVLSWDQVKEDAAAGKFAAGDTVSLIYTYDDGKSEEATALPVVATFNDDLTISLTSPLASAIAKATSKDSGTTGKASSGTSDKTTGSTLATVPAVKTLQDGYYSAKLVTDSNGTAKLARMAAGTYEITETAAPAGWHEQVAGKTWTLTVGSDGRVSVADSGKASAAAATLSVKNDENVMGTTAASQTGTKYVASNGDTNVPNTVEGVTATVNSTDGKATIIDTVRYTGTVKGQTYTAVGTLHLKNIAIDGTVTDGGALTAADGKPVTAQTKFIADGTSGEVNVTFSFDASELTGRYVVAYEQMLDAKGQIIMKHENINDEGQTIRIQPEIGTTLTASDGTHTVADASGEIELTDTVSYTGLTPGVEHTVSGKLMSSTNDSVLKDTAGNPVTAQTTFTPETANGEAKVTFKFSAENLEGTSLVAFEELTEKKVVTETDEKTGEKTEKTVDELVAEHKDLADEGQTVSFPKPETPVTPNAPGTTYDKTSDMMRAAAPFIAGALIAGAAALVYGLRQRKLYRAEEAAAAMVSAASQNGFTSGKF